MEFFDSHAHYDDNRFDDGREETIKEIYNSGVTKIISAGYSLEGSKRSLELSSKFDFIYSTIGISPNDLIPYKYKEENNQIEDDELESSDKKYNWQEAIEEADKLISQNLS